MYNFGKQVTDSAKNGIPKQGIYKDGIQFTRMTPKNQGEEIVFKILPAFDPGRSVMDAEGHIHPDPNSWVPFKDAGGNLAPWGRYIYTAPFTGHGKSGKGSSRREIISLKSFADGDAKDVYCPLQILIDTCNNDPAWKYLVEDVIDPATANNKKPDIVEKKALNNRLSAKMLCNIVNIREPEKLVFLAEFSTSALPALFGEGGLANSLNINATQEQVNADPMSYWACGDLTNLEKGPVLKILKDPKDSAKGSYAGFTIMVAMSGPEGRQQPIRKVLQPEYLGYRYNLLDLDSILHRPSVEDLVDIFIKTFNQWDPTRRYHEFELLKQCFGHVVQIPEPPARGAVPGFGTPPAQPQFTPPGFGDGQFPARPPAGGFPPIAPQTPQHLPGVTVPGFATAPEEEYVEDEDHSQLQNVAAQRYQQPVPQYAPPPPVQQQQFAPPPAQQQFIPAQQPYTPPPVQQAPQYAPPPVQQQYAPPAPQGVPTRTGPVTIPGEPVAKFDRDKFLSDVKNKKK